MGSQDVTRTDLCAAGDGLIVWQTPRFGDPGWEHENDHTRFRDGHVAQPMPQCPMCGSPKVSFVAADPWSERCLECGTTIDATSEEIPL